MTEGADFVTVAECARLLGCDPRQVRRYAARLADADTDRTASDGYLRVRVEAVRKLRQAAKPSTNGTGGQGHGLGHGQARASAGLSVEQIVQVYEKALAERERTIQVLLANIQDLRRMLPAPPAEADTDSDSKDGPEPASVVATEEAAPAQANDPRHVIIRAPRPWWRIWAR